MLKRNKKGQFKKRKTGEQYHGYPIWYDHKGYPCIHVAGKDVKAHVFAWELRYGPKPKGHDIHHRDFNKKNFKYDNLVLLTHSDHQKIHAGWLRRDGVWTHKKCNGCGLTKLLEEF